MSRADRRDRVAAEATAVFAESGYRGASIEEIARRSGVSAPVVYDHFESKLDLFKCLLEAHFAELRQIWRQYLGGEGTVEEKAARSIGAWFSYIEAHPFAARMLFRDTSGDAKVAAMHAEVAARSRAQLVPVLVEENYASGVAGNDTAAGTEMSWIVLREVLQGLAIWWADHPGVPREEVIQTAMNALWIGFQRVLEGEVWVEATRTPAGGDSAKLV